MKEKKLKESIVQGLKRQGRKTSWLINELSISRATFYKRLEDGDWKHSDIKKMMDYGILNSV